MLGGSCEFLRVVGRFWQSGGLEGGVSVDGCAVGATQQAIPRFAAFGGNTKTALPDFTNPNSSGSPHLTVAKAFLNLNDIFPLLDSILAFIPSRSAGSCIPLPLTPVPSAPHSPPVTRATIILEMHFEDCLHVIDGSDAPHTSYHTISRIRHQLMTSLHNFPQHFHLLPPKCKLISVRRIRASYHMRIQASFQSTQQGAVKRAISRRSRSAEDLRLKWPSPAELRKTLIQPPANIPRIHLKLSDPR